MRLLYTSTDMAFTQWVRISFDREGIGYYCSDADASLAGVATAMGVQARIYLTDDADWDRATQLLREMGAPARQPQLRSITVPRHRAWVSIGATAVVVVLLWMLLAG